eukprot:7309454-Pyramimonas_sp.AAC.1
MLDRGRRRYHRRSRIRPAALRGRGFPHVPEGLCPVRSEHPLPVRPYMPRLTWSLELHRLPGAADTLPTASTSP